MSNPISNGSDKSKPKELVWAYGVTTVPERRHTTLQPTLDSLRNGGFAYPRLFVDGAPPREHNSWGIVNASVTFRWPRVGAMKSWIMALAELYWREPRADRYALFQDDFVCVRNLRQYIDLWFPPKGYLNLYTFPHNQMRITDVATGNANIGWFETNQKGQGAVGLVFDYQGVEALLTSQYMLKKPLCPLRGHKNVDGAVVVVMRQGGFIEYCHSPTLLQHMEGPSTLGNRPHPPGILFPGVTFDAMRLLEPDIVFSDR